MARRALHSRRNPQGAPPPVSRVRSPFRSRRFRIAAETGDGGPPATFTWTTWARDEQEALALFVDEFPDDDIRDLVEVELLDNSGELADVEREYEKLILFGMAQVLWAYAYGKDLVWDGSPRDWVDLVIVPTPLAAEHAAKDLADAIAKSEEAPLTTLFALAMEIDTGEPYEFDRASLKPPKIKHPAIEILFDGFNHGAWPLRFAEEMDRTTVTGVSDEDWATMAIGDTEENEWIWDVWDGVMNDAVITDKDGTKYTLSDNGDAVCLLIPEGMEWDDADEEYVWPENTDWVPAPAEFGRALAHMALRDGISWFDDHKRTNGTMKWEPAIPACSVGFSGATTYFMWDLPTLPAPKTESTERRVRITFESITPGEEDDDEPEVENGWEDEEGVVVEHDEDQGIALATYRLLGGGNNMLGGRLPGIEPSSSSFRTGVWYTQTEGRTDYQTGEVRTLSYHLGGYTEEEEREVFDLVMGKTPIL